jgi:hypothetical protein
VINVYIGFQLGGPGYITSGCTKRAPNSFDAEFPKLSETIEKEENNHCKLFKEKDSFKDCTLCKYGTHEGSGYLGIRCTKFNVDKVEDRPEDVYQNNKCTGFEWHETDWNNVPQNNDCMETHCSNCANLFQVTDDNGLQVLACKERAPHGFDFGGCYQEIQDTIKNKEMGYCKFFKEQ